MSADSGPLPDVRMRGFMTRMPVSDVHAIIDAHLPDLDSEAIDIADSAGRILAEPVRAPISVPGFPRAAMDGYALSGEETFGADTYNPLEFVVVGESLPGRGFTGKVGPGQAVRIMTGAPLPAGANAVLRAEDARMSPSNRLEVTAAVPPGRHVSQPGEDVQEGDIVLEAHRRLRPQDLGLLASLGISRIVVLRRPVVDILITGDELLPIGSRPEGYRIVDSNSIMLRTLVARDGGVVGTQRLLPDEYDRIRSALLETTADVVLLSGGSSVGAEDFAPQIVKETGALLVHGVALRPASPTGLGVVDGRLVFLLPGNPVSCLCAYDLFVCRAIRRMLKRPPRLPYRLHQARLAEKIVSEVGRLDYVRVRLTPSGVAPLAVRGASILSSTTRASGFVLVPPPLEGYPAGSEVEVFLYDDDLPELMSSH